MTKSFASLLLGLMVAIGVGNANAGTLPSKPTVTLNTASGLYLWRYKINLQKGEGLSSTVPLGNYFTIYDIAGWGGSCHVPNTKWKCTVQFVGLTPSTQNIVENAGLVNLTFIYVGASPLIGIGQDIGDFGFNSIYSGTTTGTFAAQTMNSVSGGVDQENGPVLVPSASAAN